MQIDKKEDQITHGVETFILKENDTIFSVWDFAGHEEYHVTKKINN